MATLQYMGACVDVIIGQGIEKTLSATFPIIEIATNKLH